jgi:hypothetical protein
MDEWFNKLKLDEYGSILQEKKFKGIPYVLMVKNKIKDSYDNSVKSTNKGYNLHSIVQFLIDIGFSEINTTLNGRSEVILRMPRDKYDLLIDERKGELLYEAPDDEDDGAY